MTTLETFRNFPTRPNTFPSGARATFEDFFMFGLFVNDTGSGTDLVRGSAFESSGIAVDGCVSAKSTTVSEASTTAVASVAFARLLTSWPHCGQKTERGRTAAPQTLQRRSISGSDMEENLKFRIRI